MRKSVRFPLTTQSHGHQYHTLRDTGKPYDLGGRNGDMWVPLPLSLAYTCSLRLEALSAAWALDLQQQGSVPS